MVNLQSTDNPVAVIGMEGFRIFWVNLFQLAQQIFPTLFFRQLLQLFSILLVGFCFGKGDVLHQGIHIQSGSPHQDGLVPTGKDAINRLVCQLHIIGHAEWLARVKEVHQMMGNPLLFLFGGLCGGDVHPFVNLHRIRRNDFPLEPLGDLDA